VNASAIMFAVAVVGLIVNTLAVLGIAWKGGYFNGQIVKSIEGLGKNIEDLKAEVGLLRSWREENTGIVSRVVAQLDNLERRVGHLEGH